MQFYLQTRGRTRDYAFLGASPSQMWWKEFSQFTSFEHPTILVLGDKSNWRSYVSGIPSRRQDRVGTQIRYTLVVSGKTAGSHDEIIGLITRWIAESSDGAQFGEVQDSFDSVFSEDDVERLLLDRSAAPNEEVENNIRLALDRLRVSPPSTKSENDSWVGNVVAPEARQEFILRVSEILQGEYTGVAALLNLSGAQEAERLLERHDSVAVLVDDTEHLLGSSIVPLKKKNALQRPSQMPKGYTPRAITLGLGLLLLAALLIWLFLRSR
jgi:hypothetical protein